MDRRVIRNALLVAALVGLLAVVSPRVGYAEPGGQAEPDPFDLLIQALRDAEEKKLFYDDSPLVHATEFATDWLVNEIVNKNIPTSQEQTEDREELLRNIKGQRLARALEETLVYLRKYDLLDPGIAKTLADWYTEKIAGMVNDDRPALVALYNATNGDNWVNNANWLSNEPMSEWHGVETAAGRVTYLDLSDNGLTGEIPPEIGNLSQLSYLSLANNDLSGQIPVELGDLPNLEQLYLMGNGFTGCVPDNLYDLRTYIPDGPFGPHIWSFGGIHEFGYNFDIPRCGQMSPLVILYEATDGDNWTNNANWLSDNPVSEWHGVTLDESSNVVRLELDDNNLSGRIPAEVGNLPSLEYLSLFGNRLSGDIPPELGDLSNLETLSLGGNPLSGCLPDGLSYVPRIDISALGVPFCGAGSDAPAPSLALAAFSPSSTKVNLFWLNGLEAEAVTIYRDGMPVATPPLDLLHYTDSGLSSNVRYEYRIEANLADGSAEAAEASVATLAHPPRMVELMDVNESGFTLVIVDESNPPGTEYRITLNDMSGENKVVSDWSASRCVTFEGLQPDISYSFEAVAGNLDGIESEPGDWIYDDYDRWRVQAQPGNDDPWAIYKINGAAGVYGLTEAARRWMLSDIRVKFYRNEPGYAGYSPREPVAGVGNVPMGAFIHEVMHGFTHHWTGFPQPCDVMNIHTFKRDVARFLLDFRDYDQSGRQNPLEDWRPFYNSLVSLRSEDFWELLQRGDYHELDALYHFTDADIPSAIAGKLSLLPPTLRPQFDGFIAESADAATWREELYWYSSLPPQEMRLWDTAYNYHGILHHSPQYAAPPSAPRTNIPAQKRELLRNADRRVLVDFVNTLEDISCNLQDPCKELWNSDFGFWTSYVHRNLYRARLYLEELSAGAGIELAPDNLAAVKGIMRPMVSGVSCGGVSNPSTLRWRINSETAISDLQRNALLAMVDVLERHHGWHLPCGSDAALAEAWSDISPRGFIHSHSAPAGGTD